MSEEKKQRGVLVLAKEYGWIVAYISLFLGLGTAWFTFCLPFSPNPNFGSIFIISTESGQNNSAWTLGLPITFYNSGSWGGVINDISIKMQGTGKNNFTAMFYPAMYYDSTGLAKAKFNKQPDLFALEESFTGIYLPPKQYTHSEIMFYKEHGKNVPKLEPGKYKFSIYIQKPNSSFSLYDTREETIDQETINNIEQGKTKMTVLMNYPHREKFNKQHLTE